MKKSYLLFAFAAGMMLTACTSDDDYAAQNTTTVEQSGDAAVLFDTYLSNNNTRSGQEGVMSTTTLQSTGFGIFAMQGTLASNLGSDVNFTPTIGPNFMWNQYVSYVASNWTYAPLKYWPNETTTDKASSNDAREGKVPVDNEGISFYAYAPFVTTNASIESAASRKWDGYQLLGTNTTAGIISATTNATTGDPKIHYRVASGAATGKYPSNSVDLLWGVSSGFNYHPVNQLKTDGTDAGTSAIIMPKGLPVEKMQKPALEEKIKFDFKHALARIGLTIVGAFDQKAQGGTLDDFTRVTIEEITVTGDAFATEGVLNLDNTNADLALWEFDTDDDYKFNVKIGSPVPAKNNQGQIKVTYGTADEMNPELRFVNATAFPDAAGVKSTEQYVLTENSYTQKSSPEFDYKKTYFSDEAGTPVMLNSTNVEWTTTGSWFTIASGIYTQTFTVDNWSMGATASTKTAKEESVNTGVLITDLSASGKTYYTRSGSGTAVDPYIYTPKPTGEMAKDGDGKLTEIGIFTLEEVTPIAKYKSTVYELTTKPRYFMVIPTTADRATNKVVTVTIKYHVTTKDSKVDGGVVDVTNIISQDVTLDKFTNGKAYNLKVILGLTSVKVDAEVSNWEVGTVESNLPQNLE